MSREPTDPSPPGDVRPRPTLNQLEAFVRVVRHRTYAGAAREMGLDSASPLWRALSRLQKNLQVDLLEPGRGHHAVSPTRAGKALLQAANEVIAAVDRFAALATDVREGNYSTIRVGCTPAHVSAGVAEAISAFKANAMQVKVELSQVVDDHRGGGEDLFSALVRREADVIVTPDRPDVDLSRFSRWAWYQWWLVALRPPGDSQDEEGPLQIDDLRDQPLLLRPRGFTSRSLVDKHCNSAGFEPRVAYETPSSDALLAMRDAGHGIAILPHDVLPRGLTHDLHPVVSRTNESYGRWYAVYARKRDVDEDADLHSFVEELVEAGRRPNSPAAAYIEDIRRRFNVRGVFFPRDSKADFTDPDT